jgi:hypothetical protein
MVLPDAKPVDRRMLQVKALPITKLMKGCSKRRLEFFLLHVNKVNQFHWMHVEVFAIQKMCKRDLQFSRLTVTLAREKGSGLVLEVFARSCRFSKACKEFGLRVLAIDKDPKRAENFPVASFDLTRQHDFQTVCKFVQAERDNICWAHFAPSCGTASKARERRIPGVANPPRPLRSESYPDGLQGLSEKEARVKEANLSYAAMVELLLLLISLGIAVSVETHSTAFFG